MIHHSSSAYVDNLGLKYYTKALSQSQPHILGKLHDYCPYTVSVSTELVDNRIKDYNHGPVDINLHLRFSSEAIGAKGIDPENISVSVRTVYNMQLFSKLLC